MAVAVDQTDPAEAVIYAGVHDYGVAVLTLHDQDPDPAIVDWEFDASRQVRVETAGNPFSVSIRRATPEAPKALLVSDGVGGLRLYVEEE